MKLTVVLYWPSMAKPSQAILAAIGSLGAEIFFEMSSPSWKDAAMVSVRELGVTIGYHPGIGRSRNDDRAVVVDVESSNSASFRVAIVCDGVGGSEMGDEAAALAVAAFVTTMARFRGGRLAACVIDAIRRADDVVRAECKGRGATTLSVLVAVRTGDWVAANVGDSRIFSWTAATGQIEQLSVDDTFENEMRDLNMVDPSVLDARGLRGTLSQAIGEAGRASEDLAIRIIGGGLLEAGAILATDGAWKGGESGFRSIASHAGNHNLLVSRVVNFAMWTGGKDNISVIAIDNMHSFATKTTDWTMSAAECRVSLWAAGKKVTICSALGPISSSPNEPMGIAGKKRKPRRSKRSAPKLDPDLHNLHAGDSSDLADDRPHIEVTTDDDAT